MKTLNLATAPIWRFCDETGHHTRMSLVEVLQSDTLLYHAPLVGYLTDIQHELLASILQVAVDTIWLKGLPTEHFGQLVNSHYQSVDVKPTIRKIFDTLKEIEGFSLTGLGAFMQMPQTWSVGCRKLPIAKLMWPYIPKYDPKSTAKGLRRPDRIPSKFGPDLTALYLFSACTLARSGSLYWTSGNLANRNLVHLHYGVTLRQKLFCAVLPGISKEWKPLQPLLWIPKCKNNGGLDYKMRPPSWYNLIGSRIISGTANSRFFLANAIILSPPGDGKCDISGKTSKVFDSYFHLTEPSIQKKVSALCRRKKEIKVAGIMGRMFKNCHHPSISIIPVDKKEAHHFYKLQPSNSNSFPPWALLTFVSYYPSAVIKELKTVINASMTKTTADLHLFSLRYDAKNQDVKNIIQCRDLELSIQNNNLKDVVYLTQITIRKIHYLQKGIRFLLSHHSNGKPKKNIPNKHFNLLTSNLENEIWDGADRLYAHFLEKSSSSANSHEIFQTETTRSIDNLTNKIWNNFMDNKWKSGLKSIPEWKSAYKATRIVIGGENLKTSKSFYDNIATVKASRAFAREYLTLKSHEKHRLQRSSAPYESRYFWRCIKKAKKEDSKLYEPFYENLLFLLEYITPSEEGINVGRMLSTHSCHIDIKHVEAILSLSDRESIIDTLGYILRKLSFKTGSQITLDFGVLFYDLSIFPFRSDYVKRSWANQYFNWISDQTMENSNVST
ncbi:MAG: hypothetical protein ACI8ZB_003801 [Desulforhopalus sp.]|jgi:hypothetical protein